MEKLINDFSFGLFFWQTLLFLLLLFLLKKYAWKPILDALNSREEGIQKALDEADKARQEMVDLKSSNEKIIKEARAERDSMLKDARTIKEKMITEAKDEAKAQSNKIIEQAKQTIENEKLAAITELKNQVAELSIGIAEKIMKDELSSKDKQVKLIEKMLDEARLK
ncbi:MAG: F0F1 ATP synthase subunit B [Flavobacteriaceae bacterium]|nr:MAG: F0F1 ATP synthase subunit B [Flavobacteriaceae bacterium]